MPLTFLLSNWKLILAAVLAAFTFYAGYSMKGYQCESDIYSLKEKHNKDLTELEEKHEAYVKQKEKEQQDARQQLEDLINKERKAKQEISKKLEAELKNIKVIERVVINTIEKEIEKPIYSQCSIPATGVRAINDAADKYNKSR